MTIEKLINLYGAYYDRYEAHNYDVSVKHKFIKYALQNGLPSVCYLKLTSVYHDVQTTYNKDRERKHNTNL